MKKFEKLTIELLKQKRKEEGINFKNEKLSRKERARKLIELGLLVYNVGLFDEDRAYIQGLLLKHFEINEEEKDLIKEIGQKFLKKIENKGE